MVLYLYIAHVDLEGLIPRVISLYKYVMNDMHNVYFI